MSALEGNSLPLNPLAHPAVLKVSGLTVFRGSTIILENISWTVRRGEHWAILGANGSGKTSLLSALTGYLTPSAGDLEVLGQRFGASDWPALRKKIGLVSSSIRQLMPDAEPALLSVLSGRYAMIDFWGKPKKADVQKARRILRQIEGGHLADRPWLFLSQGERQRVLLGRALMAEPKLLILDEPCAGLDPAAREHFLQFLQRLGEIKGAPTLIFVTHHVEEIMPAFNHALLLKSGGILAAGKKEATLTSKLLSETFRAQVRLIRGNGRYQALLSDKASRAGPARKSAAKKIF